MLFAILLLCILYFYLHIHLLYEVIAMRKFKIPVVPSTTNKCVRFPNDLIEQVEKEIVGKDCTFSAFVIEAVRVALENLHEEQE